MVIHLIHNPICAKKFVNPIVTFLNNNGIKTELWLEPWEKTNMFTLSVDCPKRFAWFDLSINPFIVMTRVFSLWKRLRKVKPTAIHTHQTRAAFIPLLAGAVTRVPVRIYHNHGTPYLGYSGILRRLLWLLEFLNCKLSNHVVTVSESIRGRMIRDGVVKATKCDVLGEGSACGIDLNEFSAEQFDKQHIIKSRQSLGIALDAFVVLYIGRPFKRKGFNVLLESWLKVRVRINNSVLLIAGCNSKEVAAAIDQSLEDVIALGYVEDLRAYYAACDVVVLPSYHEGFPYSLLEGAAAGRALVGSNVPGIDSAIKHNETGLLVSVGDEQALATALITLRDDPELRGRLGINARSMVEKHFDRKVFEKELLDYYGRIGIKSYNT
jgi:glycosyltransferase involved in cell wall biosynthesis